MESHSTVLPPSDQDLQQQQLQICHLDVDWLKDETQATKKTKLSFNENPSKFEWGLREKDTKTFQKVQRIKKMANSKTFECPTKSVRNHFNVNK